MLRLLYIWLIRLHPPYFRARFAAEMQWIFDQVNTRSERASLLVDGLLSLARQWTLRSGFWGAPPAMPAQSPATNHLPLFYTFDKFKPRTGALIHGALLAVALFWTACLTMSYSWNRTVLISVPYVGRGSNSVSAAVTNSRSPTATSSSAKAASKQSFLPDSKGWQFNKAWVAPFVLFRRLPSSQTPPQPRAIVDAANATDGARIRAEGTSIADSSTQVRTLPADFYRIPEDSAAGRRVPARHPAHNGEKHIKLGTRLGSSDDR